MDVSIIRNLKGVAFIKRADPWIFYCLAIISGCLVGLAGGYFQLFLHAGDRFRNSLIEWLRTLGDVEGFFVLAGLCMFCALVARALVRLSPTAGGSGIQYVEAVWKDEVQPARIKLLPVKFIGGLLSLGSGMALGREGPTVQMGAAIGAWFSRVTKLEKLDFKYLVMASAGTGLGVAFSAPLGGAMFVFEEVTRSLNLRLVIATVLCASVGCTVSMSIIGFQPDYLVNQTSFALPNLQMMIFTMIFGIVVGLFGVLYNKMVLALLNVQNRLGMIPPEVRAAFVGLVVAVLLWFMPHWAGSGDPISQSLLNGTMPITALATLAVIRWFFAPLCYSTGVPGGLFSPLLLMGGILGQLYCWVVGTMGYELNPLAFCALGMSAFFASTICSPFTGVLLILEMTSCWDLTIPMLFASIISYATFRTVGSLPIYTALRLRIPAVQALQKQGVDVLDKNEEPNKI